MALSWVAVNANNGQMIADLPDLEVSGMLKCTMMRYESQTANLPMSSAPSNWVQATRPGAVWIVCLDEDGVTPLWGGMVIDRQRSDGELVPLTLATPEAYFDRRYVGDVTYAGVSQNLIVQDLIARYAKTGALSGIPIRVQIIGGNGAARDRAYLDSADKTLYSILGELGGLIGGPEWSVGWENVNNLITPVLFVGDRLGRDPAAGLGPAAQFILPGNITSANLVESYASGGGANRVMATSSGSGGARPQSTPQTNTTDMRPTFEYRWSPSTSITDPATLTAHAQRALSTMQNGTLALTIKANRQEAPALGRDWFIGDTVGFDLSAPAWPNGITGTARVIAWEMDDNTIVPIINVSTIQGI